MKNWKAIKFNVEGHDGFIDFIKAYALLCVLFGHTFLWIDRIAYGVWAGMQVPLFILVQAFHYYKKESYRINYKRLLHRIIIPFTIVELLTFALALLFGVGDFLSLVKYGIKWGGFGPGSYFPYIYIQIAVVLPFVGIILKRCGYLTSLLTLVIISECFEILFSVIHVSDYVYRLLMPRYLLLLHFGWQWAKEGVRQNSFTLSAALVGLVLGLYFEYFFINDEPWLFTTDFKFHRWPCYFWVAYGLIPVLYLVWKQIKGTIIIKAIQVISECSYEMFLIQMALLFLFQKEDLVFVTNTTRQYVVWVLTVWFADLVGGYCLRLITNRLQIVNNK